MLLLTFSYFTSSNEVSARFAFGSQCFLMNGFKDNEELAAVAPSVYSSNCTQHI
jgi:hypothetical protein